MKEQATLWGQRIRLGLAPAETADEFRARALTGQDHKTMCLSLCIF